MGNSEKNSPAWASIWKGEPEIPEGYKPLGIYFVIQSKREGPKPILMAKLHSKDGKPIDEEQLTKDLAEQAQSTDTILYQLGGRDRDDENEPGGMEFPGKRR